MTMELKIAPPILMIIFVFLMGLLSWFVPSFSWPRELRTTLILFCVACSVTLWCSAVLAFRRAGTTINPHHPHQARVLLTGGIFRFSRNPVYLGFLMLLIGWALFLANWSALVLCVLFVFYINRFQIVPEERALKKRFGETYLAYQARVRRWL